MADITFINLTPHAITVLKDGEVDRIFKSEGIVRVESTETIVGEIAGIPISDTKYGDVIGLPEPVADTMFIVSRVVINALEKKNIVRNDLVVPGMQVRDSEGRVVGCKSLALN